MNICDKDIKDLRESDYPAETYMGYWIEQPASETQVNWKFGDVVQISDGHQVLSVRVIEECDGIFEGFICTETTHNQEYGKNDHINFEIYNII